MHDTRGDGTGDRGGRDEVPAERPGPLPVHRRSMRFEAFDDGDTVTVTGTLADDRPWAAGTASVEHVHDMELTVRVRKDDSTIVDARAAMRRFPHVECPGITTAFEGLVGLRVARGYTRAVQERVGGAAGCTHLDQLARALGPVVVQALTSCRARRRDWEALDTPAGAGAPGFSPDMCHVWADDGPGRAKVAAGWRPGAGEYPAPSVAVVVRRLARGGDS